MSLAAETRDAARRHPFVLSGLRAGVLNYTAAARFLDVSGDDDAVATALRRFAEELPDWETSRERVRVTMHRGVRLVEDKSQVDDPLLEVGGTVLDVDDAVSGDDQPLTAMLAVGNVDAEGLAAVLGRLFAVDVSVHAAGVAGDALVVAVDGTHGATALRVFEDALDAVPMW